ncbi:unnamed protein product [Leuciscus chuanchicus]
MAWPAPLHLTDPFILEAHWRPEMSEEDSAQCLLSPRPHMRVEGRGLASRLPLRQCRRLLMWALAETSRDKMRESKDSDAPFLYASSMQNQPSPLGAASRF